MFVCVLFLYHDNNDDDLCSLFIFTIFIFFATVSNGGSVYEHKEIYFKEATTKKVPRKIFMKMYAKTIFLLFLASQAFF